MSSETLQVEAPPSTLVLRREKFTEDLAKEGSVMFEDHAREAGHTGNILPDYSIYVFLEKMGLLRVYTARIDGLIVGYCLFIVSPYLHDKTSLRAMQDALYVQPAHRGRVSMNLLRYCSESLANEGVRICYQITTVKRDFGKVLKRLGFKLDQNIYIKHLQEGRGV